MRSPSSTPGPRNERPDVRFALSYDALKINGTPARCAISCSRPASVAACCSLSMTHGPAMSTNGLPPPIERSPNCRGATGELYRRRVGLLATYLTILRGWSDVVYATVSAGRSAPCAVLCRHEAATNAANSGCGRVGFDLNSGWNCTATYHGCPGSSAISTNLPSGERPEIFRPCSERVRSHRQLNS